MKTCPFITFSMITVDGEEAASACLGWEVVVCVGVVVCVQSTGKERCTHQYGRRIEILTM